MSITYTRWTLHGEDACTGIIESSDLNGSQHEDRSAEEEEQDKDISIFLEDRDLVTSLLTSDERARKKQWLKGCELI
jgi:hypothetical protein